MRLVKYFLLCVVVGVPNLLFANSYSAIDYKITPVFSNGTFIIKVDTTIKGKLSNKVIIDLPYVWAGVEYFEQIKNIKLTHPQGKIQLNKYDDNYQAIITMPKTNSINLSYEVHQKPDDRSNVYETIIRKDLVHSTGYGLFVIPSDLKDTDEVEFNVVWKNIPNKWKTLSSYGTDKSLKFVANTSQLLHAIYLAGDLRIYQIVDSNNPVYLSLYGDFDLKDDLITSFLSEIITSQRSFFNDHDFPYYAISLIEGDNPHSMGGTSLHNSFTAFLPKGMNKINYYLLFAHEHLHNWVGGKIRNNTQEERLSYWWSEGFTDYYSKVLALRSGGISMTEFINKCNQFLKNYYLSPVLNEPNDRIKHDFRKDYDVQKLPYYRGFVFAIYLNHLIKKNNSDNSLDYVMLDLFKTAKQREFSVDYFQNIVKTYIPQGIAKEISMFIDKGKTIELSDLAIVLPIKKTKMGAYDPGFDRKSFNQEKIIKNINTNSNAYKAGLRNEDKIIEWDLPKGQDPDQIVEIKTTNKTFKFRPENLNKKMLYQFRTNLSQEDILKINKFLALSKKLCKFRNRLYIKV